MAEHEQIEIENSATCKTSSSDYQLPENRNRAIDDQFRTINNLYTCSPNLKKISTHFDSLAGEYEFENNQQRSRLCRALGSFAHPSKGDMELTPLRKRRRIDAKTPNPVKDYNPRCIQQISVLFAPVVIAENATILSRHLRKKGFKSDVVDYFPSYLNYDADHVFRGKYHHELIRFSDDCIALAESYDVIVLEFGCSFKYLPGFNTNLAADEHYFSDVLRLKEKGKKILVSFWGSDANAQSRLHYRYLQNIGIDSPEPPQQTRLQHHLVAKLCSLSDGVLGSTLFNQVIPRSVPFYETPLDLQKWPFTKRRSKNIEKILSAPSNRRKKNYEIIDSVIGATRNLYPQIEPLIVEGIPHSKVREFYQQADLGITQATYSFGLLAVELMALGIPVMVPHWETPRFSHRDTAPVIHFDSIFDLKDRLEQILKGNIDLASITNEGRQYVETFHNSEVVGNVLANYLEQVVESGSVQEIQFPEFIEKGRIWNEDPERITAFKYYDISVPVFCALGDYLRAYSDCNESIVNGYRTNKFEAWRAAICKKSGMNEKRNDRYLQELVNKRDIFQLNRIKDYLATLFDSNKLLAEIEFSQNQACYTEPVG